MASRRQAHDAIAEGRVLVSGAVADKAARLVASGEPVLVQGDRPRFVSRGGEKLDAALDAFEIDVLGWRAVDVGASTGGFTDCLLQRGASLVYAVDVGYGQLDQRLRADGRVRVVERTNARALQAATLVGPGERYTPVDLVTADLSFISLTTVAPSLVPLVRPGGALVVLVKPQFESGRAEVSRGRGVVRDPGLWEEAMLRVARALQGAGTGIMGAMRSPVTGQAGNTEFLLHAVVGEPAPVPTATLVTGALAGGRAGTDG